MNMKPQVKTIQKKTVIDAETRQDPSLLGSVEFRRKHSKVNELCILRLCMHMEDAPNYESYSYDELFDTKKHIDKHRFP